MLNIRFLPLLGIAVTAQPALAASDLRGVWYAGGIASRSPSINAGLVYSLPRSRLGRGLAVRAGIGGGSYDYEASGREIHARYATISTGLVYQTSTTWGWANLSAGPSVTRTRLSPTDLNNKSRGTRFDATAQVDGGFQPKSYDIRWIGSVALRDRSYYARLQPGIRVNAQTSAGVDLGAQGGRTYKQQSFGLFARRKVGDVDLTANVGWVHQLAVKNRPFAGLALSRVF